ncbi:FAD binding domain-domain-containing protein [Clohesyomyces aquaticus]|uniref:FAD binding domain-domain-containing protein n=1 Tax=Clohesyomyces aquaticus TaxID=1231657 RepID=A0A1Y1Y032_9PLEO|nr:FAD binding domain-domain-containing protein [Clohesyomyces aquaticus]
MTASFWDMMKRPGTSSKAHSTASSSSAKIQKMAPGLRSDSPRSRSIDAQSTSTEATTSSSQSQPDDYRQTLSDVVVVGAGPAGLMLAYVPSSPPAWHIFAGRRADGNGSDNLVRFGIKTRLIDDRPDRTSTGRADGIQPKTIETLRQMRLAEPLLRKGVRVYDIAFWTSTALQSLHRTAREIHYPPVVDLLDPYILLVHQGMVEKIFQDDLKERGVHVQRNTAFVEFEHTPQKVRPLQITCKDAVDHTRRTYGARYLVGCDGAHSQVRRCLPDARPIGSSRDAIWGVLDGVLETDFPDIWSKVVVHSEELGSILMIPRERNMTRLYIELKSDTKESASREELTREYVMKRAQEIMLPYVLNWRSVDWFGRYQVGQRVANRFTDEERKVFIAGDASHTHSPKAAQGMNTSMHDTFNLAWKLNFAVRGLAKPSLLATYEQERKKIAEDLVNFDYEHANAFAAGDPDALAANFAKNVAFISGYGVNYEYNVLNIPNKGHGIGALKPGYLLPPAKVTRFVDSNPVDIQTDIPALGQFRIYFFCRDVYAAKPFLDAVCVAHQTMSSYVGRVTLAGNASYTIQPPLAAPHDQFVCPERYTPVSGIFTYALVTDMPRHEFELDDLPVTLRESRWTVYLDDCPDKDTRGQKCIDKWLDGLAENEVVVLNVRPDGYVGSHRRWDNGRRESGVAAVKWLDEYYDQFLCDL